MHSLIYLFQALIALCTPVNLVLLSVSTVGGILIGALPGLSATMGIALLTGLTYTMPQDMALIVLIGIFVGGIYGGSISAILIGIPGTGSAAATTLDGYPLAKKGLGREALSATTIASFIGTLFGMLCLIALTPVLQSLALKFASHEFALLAIFGVMICGSLTAEGGSALKGWLAGFTGLALSCIGYEELYSMPRLTFGNVALYSGIAFVPAMIGLFGIPNLFDNLSKLPDTQTLKINHGKNEFGILKIIKRYFFNIIRSGLIGTAIGAVPGVGEDVAAWLSYDTARRSSKCPEEFGKGSFEGIIAAETANNAAIGGALIPLLSLAIPGSATTAVLLGALWLHGIRPGPMLTFEFPDFIPYMGALLLLASLTMRIFGWAICQVAPKLLKIPFFILMPVVGVLSIIGSYALNINMFDLKIMFIFGIIGFIFMKLKIPAAPIVLGLILGPIADSNFRRALQASGGSLIPFVTRPLSIVVILLIIFTVVSQTKLYKNFMQSRKEKRY